MPELSELEILARILYALVAGGLIGWERERIRRPAGFRTHILVALGSAIVMITGQKITGLLGAGDATRLAAQVISGVGFLGAGAIMREGVNVKGLTTAASLWVSACIGITIGAGLYISAGIVCLTVLVVLTLFDKVEKRFLGKKAFMEVSLRVICDDVAAVMGVLNEATTHMRMGIHEETISPSPSGGEEYTAEISCVETGIHELAAKINKLPTVRTISLKQREQF